MNQGKGQKREAWGIRLSLATIAGQNTAPTATGILTQPAHHLHPEESPLPRVVLRSKTAPLVLTLLAQRVPLRRTRNFRSRSATLRYTTNLCGICLTLRRPLLPVAMAMAATVGALAGSGVLVWLTAAVVAVAAVRPATACVCEKTQRKPPSCWRYLTYSVSSTLIIIPFLCDCCLVGDMAI